MAHMQCCLCVVYFVSSIVVQHDNVIITIIIRGWIKKGQDFWHEWPITYWVLTNGASSFQSMKLGGFF